MTTVALVSVIIPCHNRIPFLLECLDSVAKQSYPSIELIVVDDASEVGEVKKAIDITQWPPGIAIKYIRSDTKVGPGQAREMGRLQSSGDYLAYLDSDDLWHPDKLTRQVANLKAHPSAGMSYCAASQFVNLPISGKEPFFRRSDQSFNCFFPHVYSDRPWATAACLWTRVAIDKIGPWCNAWLGEDIAYDWTAGCHDIQIAYISEIFCYVRRGLKVDHLTGMTETEFTLYCMPAYQKMFETLHETGRINDPVLREWLKRRLFTEGFRLVNVGKSNDGDSYFKAAMEILKKFPSNTEND